MEKQKQAQAQRSIRRGENEEQHNQSEFIEEIGKEIERTSGAKRLCQAIVKEEWITESEMKVMQENKRIQLRTAEETKGMKVVQLKRFNPSYLYAESHLIPCCMPGCTEKTKNLIHSRDKNQNKIKQNKIKQDLFLCKTHLKTLKDRVSKRCAQEHVKLDDASFKNDYFNGYTRLIGELEKAFVYLNSKWFKSFHSLLAEVFLNSRNFLIITNALLNPDEDNRGIALGPFLTMLWNCLQAFRENPNEIIARVIALRDITNIVLPAFGVIYNWVSLANPGAELGGGIGLVFGYALGNAYGSSLEIIITTTMVGFLGGHMIGSGVFNLNRQSMMQMQQHRQIREQIIDRYGYYAPANSDGDIDLYALQNSTVT
jgi:hypothetical protein